jgi:hypothetical protein
MRLERIKEIDQVLLLCLRKANTKTLVIKVHDIEQSGCRTIMEVGRPRSEPTKDRSFDLADIGTVACNHRSARVGDHKNLTRKRPPGAFQVKTGNPEMSRAGGLLVPAFAMPMFKDALTEWSPTLGVSWHVPQNPGIDG